MKKSNDRLIAGIFTAYGLEEEILMRTLKIIVEKHPDGYVAYPLGLKGVVVAEGDTYEEALAEVKSAVQFHIETFGNDAFENNDVVETFVAEIAV